MFGKILLHSFSALQVAWIRYFGAFVAFVIVVGVAIAIDPKKRRSDYFLFPKSLRTWLELITLGVGPFVYSPILQFMGLETAQAMDNSILIATEPLITVLLAWAVLGERMTRDHWISMFIALSGFFLFSGIFGEMLGKEAGFTLSIGMTLLIFAQLGEGAYSVFGRKLVQVYPPTAVLGTALAIGAVLLTVVVVSFDTLPPLGIASGKQIAAALILGPIGSTLTYLLWAMIARTVTVPSAVITLFIQPVLGAVLGYTLLGERLTVERMIGAFLILLAIAYLFYREIRRDPVF